VSPREGPMEIATAASGGEKTAKTKKELEEMLRAALGDAMAPGEYNILVFRPTAGSPEWDAEIVSKQRVVEDGIKSMFEQVKLELQQQFEFADQSETPPVE
jgi:hypothetical protein